MALRKRKEEREGRREAKRREGRGGKGREGKRKEGRGKECGSPYHHLFIIQLIKRPRNTSSTKLSTKAFHP